ncbi:MRC1-like domain-containing protein [Coniochaeta sp. 2T2.1]|nr:MRC1-like domain-containing protein [Coniochaeta sp. 2T2.1]
MASARSLSPAGSISSLPVSPARANEQSTRPGSKTPSSPSSTASSSDDEDAILRPRGKLAARMLGQADSPQNPTPKQSDDARERVRRMLGLAAEPKESEDLQPVSSQRDEHEAEDDDEDEIIAPRPRKLQQRRLRSKTPEGDNIQQDGAQTPSPRISRPAAKSPGLFVSSPVQPRSPSVHSNAADSDSDIDLPNIKNQRFKDLVAKKRQERLAREAEEEAKRAARLARQQAEADLMADDGDDSDITDDDGGRTLTQKSRPSRKASKKALEEMSRETQRMTRSLQLAHEAKTTKKITKASLFERFNFKPEGSPAPGVKLASSSRPASPVSAHITDAEMKDDDTPPSSPPAPMKPTEDEKVAATEANDDSLLIGEGSDGELPTLQATLEAAAQRKALDKGKGKATEADLEEQAREEQQQKPLPKVRRNVRVKLPAMHANMVSLGSDDELDIQPSKGKTKIDEILSRGPINKVKESRPMYMLRRLANLDDPDKKGSAPIGIGKRATKPSMTSGELQVSLVQKARAQAKLERDRRLEVLKSKGIHIPTEEEREKERAEVEDIVARAREEAEEIMLREREAAKQDRKDRKEAGEVDPLAWEDSDASDDSYVEDNKEEETKEIELSGSEEEDAEMDDEDEEETASAKGGLIDEAAQSGAESEDVEAEDAEHAGLSDDDDDAPVLSRQPTRRPKKQVVILSDDEESDHHVEATPGPKVAYPKSPSAPNTASPKVPTSVLRSATKTFIPGLPVAGPAGLGLTQIFAGTMDDSQAGPLGATPSQMMPTFENFPDSQFSQTAQEASADDMILDNQPTQKATQAIETQEGVNLHFSQSQMHGFDSLLQQTDYTQQSELEPTQDGGFQDFTPIKQRFVDPPASTIDTVALSESQRQELQSDSPLVQRVGKLRRRADVLAAAAAAASQSEEDGEMDGVEFDEFGFGTTSAFTVMKDAAEKERKAKAKAKAAFDKKKSKAREMVDEQADESEDEYAGLGGVDGEDSDDESTASVQEMMDDDTKLSEADRAKLKAFYADRERANDEKQVEKLFKDITTGMLRRKRGADYDLSDSDDGGEAKRRMKRRQFAKMQKALFSDERISKVAENPRNQAFLKTIEDRGSDDEMDFLFAPTAPVPDSQDDSQSQAKDVVPNSQPQAAAARAPAAQRRTKIDRKPTTIGDIRASLSNLLDEPASGLSVIPSTDLESSDHSADEADAEDDDAATTTTETDSNKENRNPNPRRTTAGRAAVVDRISLKRNSSSSVSTDSSTSTSSRTGRLAFAAPASSAGGFKVPALLRRATTNSLKSGGSTAGSSVSTLGAAAATSGGGGFGEEGKIKRNAGKKSGINYFARENERRAAVKESEKRREARKWKGAEGRGKVVGNLFGGGKFE